jgi:murein tripeptide amidase MpaA
MKVLIHSEKLFQKTKTQWFRGGSEISYFCNNIQRTAKGNTFYTLTFKYEFLFDSDTVYFAYCYPYTYTKLLQDLDSLEINYSEILTRRTLCLSISEKRCELVTITAPGSVDDIKKRKGVVLSARVHPGETVGSWMIKGVLEFLTSKTKEAKALREKYVFKVLPMMNPDGVYYGNYRCGIAGSDLNRNWKTPSKILHPTIYAAKKMIKSFSKERTVELVCDFHGHSKRKNIFMYGCNLPEAPEITRCIPFIISKYSPYFFYPYCSFRMQKAKESTMRITLFKEIKVPLVYTLEASFFGGDFVRVM